jgi:hypothetical protein
MKVFAKMSSMVSSLLLGASAERRIKNEQLARRIAATAPNDAELAAYYARLAATLPALQAQRAREDAEWSVQSPRRDYSGRIAEAKLRCDGESASKANTTPCQTRKS